MDLIDKMLSQQKTDWMKEYTSNDENQQKSHIFKNTMSSYKRITKREKKLQIIWIGTYKQRGQN